MVSWSVYFLSHQHSKSKLLYYNIYNIYYNIMKYLYKLYFAQPSNVPLRFKTDQLTN